MGHALLRKLLRVPTSIGSCTDPLHRSARTHTGPTRMRTGLLKEKKDKTWNQVHPEAEEKNGEGAGKRQGQAAETSDSLLHCLVTELVYGAGPIGEGPPIRRTPRSVLEWGRCQNPRALRVNVRLLIWHVRVDLRLSTLGLR